MGAEVIVNGRTDAAFGRAIVEILSVADGAALHPTTIDLSDGRAVPRSSKSIRRSIFW